jgi:hypothetical protein
MPPRKQPETLREMLISRFCQILYDRCRACISRLPEAAMTGLEAYLEQLQKMDQESKLYFQLLTDLPLHIFEDISYAVSRSIIDIISEYDTIYRNIQPAPPYDEEQYTTAYRNIVRSVLYPTITAIDTSGIYSSFVQRLVIETLEKVQHLTHFVLDTPTETDHSALLASNISHLTRLQIFTYMFHCTDQVVEQLALHCSQLRIVSFSNSTAVTDASVPHLLRLRKLKYVNIDNTSISCESYQALLKKLPEIANINCSHPYEGILHNIGTERLDTVTKYRGSFRSTEILTQICPNITHLKLYKVNYDVSNLAALNNLKTLEVIRGNYITSNLQVVLNVAESRLTVLELERVKNVNISHIIRYCSQLLVLSLEQCTFISMEFDPAACHFISVRTVQLEEADTQEMLFPQFKYYVNLEKFVCRGMRIINDVLVEQAIRQGALAKLEVFLVVETGVGNLTIDTAKMILSHCKFLRLIGCLDSWGQLTAADKSSFRNLIQGNNLNIQVM